MAVYGTFVNPSIKDNINVAGFSSGTTYLFDSTLVYGVLIMNNKGTDGPDSGTYVTSVGSGIISHLSADTLVCDTCHFPVYNGSTPGLKGLTVEANPTHLHFLVDQFKILWNDSTRLVIDTTGGKSLLHRAVPGNLFHGIINLDTLRIRGKAKAYSNDPVIYDYIDILDGKFVDPEKGLLIGSAKWLTPDIRFASLDNRMADLKFRPFAKVKQHVQSASQLISEAKLHLSMSGPQKTESLLASNLLKTIKAKMQSEAAMQVGSADKLIHAAKAKAGSVSPSSRDGYSIAKSRAIFNSNVTNSVATAASILSKAKATVIDTRGVSDNGFARLSKIQSCSVIHAVAMVQGKEKAGAVVSSALSTTDRNKEQPYTFVSRYKDPAYGKLPGIGNGSKGNMQIASAGLDPQYTYDILGRRTSMTDPTGTTNYEYDTTTGNLSAIVDPSGKRFAFTYNKGQLKSMSYPNGISANYAFDDNGNLTALDYGKGGANVAQFHYGYDDNNMRTSMTDNDGVHIYGYDQLYQIIRATHPTAPKPLEQFTYDSVGNRLTVDGNPFVWQYDDLNRLMEDDKYLYSYDDDGNMVLKVDKATNDSAKFEYNVENKMVKVEKRDTVVEFVYDALGRRLAKTVNGISKGYRYDGEDLILELNNNDSIVAKYTFGPGIDRPLKMVRDGNEYYYVADGLGSIAALTDAGGNVVQQYKYSVFGEMLEKTGNVENPFTYTAREWDGEIGLYYYRARFYDAKTGRFINQDPIMPNPTYEYCRNAIMQQYDPLGLFPVPISPTGYYDCPTTQRIINNALKTWEQNPLKAIMRHHDITDLDFSSNPNELVSKGKYCVHGKELNAGQFGNYLASLGATSQFGELGYLSVGIAGNVLSPLSHPDEWDKQGNEYHHPFQDNEESVEYINKGRDDAYKYYYSPANILIQIIQAVGGGGIEEAE